MYNIEVFYLLGYNAVKSVEKSTDVSEEHVASIFMVERISQARNQRESSSLTLNMEATCSSETSVDFQTDYTALYIPEDKILHNHPCENLKSYKLHFVHNF
jgi:hypothetical protein